jgi:hypothetical protein
MIFASGFEYIPKLEIHDHPKTGNNRDIIPRSLIPNQLKVACKMKPLVNFVVIIDFQAPEVPQAEAGLGHQADKVIAQAVVPPGHSHPVMGA